MRVQYEEVVAAYEQGLQTQLRGFRPVHAFLETWVHDADPARSVLSMVEAAELGGVKDLEVALGPGLAARIDRRRLVETAAEMGKSMLEEEDGGIVLRVSGLGGGKRAGKAVKATTKKEGAVWPALLKAASEKVNPADPTRYYVWALDRFPVDAPSEFESHLPETGKECAIRASVGGITLSARVDPETHHILHMAHDAKAKGRSQDRAILNALCSVSRGYTVQDVSEHAVIRLESTLRGQKPRPVPGVLQPENASPALGAMVGLVRDLLKDYTRKTGYKIQPNFEEGPVLQNSSEWGTSTIPERKQRIQAALPAICPETGIRGADVRINAIAGPRVTVALPATAPKEAQRRYLTLAEPLLRARVDRKIELFLDDKRDANAKRHGREV